MNESQVACGCFVVAGCQTAGAFEFVEAALDAVPQGVGDGINVDRLFSIDFAGYDRCAATSCDH